MRIYPIENKRRYTILAIQGQGIRYRDLLPRQFTNRFEPVLNDLVEMAAAAMIESGRNPTEAANAAAEIGAAVRRQLQLKTGRTSM